MFGRLLGWYTIYTLGGSCPGLLPPDGILPGAIFTLRSSLAFSCIGTLLHGTPAAGISQTAASYTEWNYGTFAEGATYIRLGVHHVGHQPTF